MIGEKAVTYREEYIKKVDVDTQMTAKGPVTKVRWLFSTGRTFEERYLGLEDPREQNLYVKGRVWATLQAGKVIAISAY